MIYKYVILSRPVHPTVPYTIPAECVKGSLNSTFQNQTFNISSKWCFYSTVPVSLLPAKNQGIISKTPFPSSTIFSSSPSPIEFIPKIFPSSVYSFHLNHYDSSWPIFISWFYCSNSLLIYLDQQHVALHLILYIAARMTVQKSKPDYVTPLN